MVVCAVLSSFCVGKNLILGGVKSVGLYDNSPVEVADLGSHVSNFLINQLNCSFT